MKRSALALLLLVLSAGVLVAIEARWLDIAGFVGIQQQAPSGLCPTSSCRRQTNVDVSKVGVIQRVGPVSSISTVTGFGTVSNMTLAFSLDPLGADAQRSMWLAAGLTTPTTGAVGQHILAASLNDTGSGMAIGTTIPWRQVDNPWELAYDTSEMDGFVGHTKYNGLGFMSCDSGIIEVGGELGSVQTANVLTSSWVGAPGRIVAVGTSTAGNPNGTYKYRVTYVSANGESRPSKQSNTVTVASKRITLTLPIAPSELGAGSSFTTARNIYRTRGGAISLTNAGFETYSGGFTGWTLVGAGATATQTADSTEVIQSCDSIGTAPVYLNYTGLFGPSPMTLETTIKSQGTGSARAPWPAITASPSNTVMNDLKTGTFYITDQDALYADLYFSAGAQYLTYLGTTYYTYSGAPSSKWLYRSETVPKSNATWFTIGGTASTWTSVNGASWAPGTSMLYPSFICSEVGSISYPNYVYLDNIRAVRDGAESGTYGAKLVRAGTDCYLEQAFTCAAGTTYTFEAMALSWGYDSTASVRVSIYDPNEGGGTWKNGTPAVSTDWGWQRVYVTETIDAGGSTSGKVRVFLGTRDGFARFDSCQLSAGSGAVGGYYYHSTISDNSTVTTTDNLADSSLGAAENLTERWYVPPGPWIEAHNERLWSCGSTGPVTQRNVLYYSDIAMPDVWPPSNLVDFNGNDGDTVTGLKSWRGSLYIFKRGSIWRMRGYDESDFEVAKVLDGIGCVDGRTICSNNAGVMFYGSGTFWLFDGTNAQDVGRQVQSYLDTIYLDSDNDSYQMCATAHADEFWFGLKTSSTPAPAFWLCYDADERRWAHLIWSTVPAFIEWPKTRSEYMVGTSAGGTVQRLNADGHDNNTALSWVTQNYDLGDQFVYKTVDSVHLSVESGYSASSAYTVSLYPDKTDAQIDEGAATAYASKSFDITTGVNHFDWYLSSDDAVVNAGGNRFRKLAIGISEASQSYVSAQRSTLSPPKVTNLTIQYRPERRVP